ncbi:replicative DNA helicase [Luteimicrobium sp. NPDC057192]|uniref:replicative DNA helicase n=1 Tax=Luteimicrobium sp. NPDC057192 TaxID=3346042 RepID=UPI00363EA447
MTDHELTPDETATAETAIVGIAMHDPTVIDDTHLSEPDFRDARLGHLWDLMRHLRKDQSPTDPATLRAHLGRLPVRIDPTWIADLYGSAPTTALADHYTRIVTDKATLRRIDAVATRLHQLVQADTPAGELVEIARAEIDATSVATADTGFLADDIDTTIDNLDTTSTLTPTPWADLNHLIGGWRPGGLYIVGARPGVGKSLVALGAAIGLAGHGQVAFNSLEMTRQEVHERLFAAVARVDMGHLTRRELTPTDWDAIARHRQDIADLPISIDDRSAVTTTDIRSHARTLTRRGPLAAIIVDYLQLMTTGRGDKRPRHEVVAEMSRDLKILAKDLNVPIIALSQLNRASEARTDRRPTMADLRESGSLEQDSDVVLLLHVEENDPTEMQVAVAKNRQGATGALQLTRRGHYARLDNATWTPHAAA